MIRITVALLCLCTAAFSADLSGKWTGRSQVPADRHDGLPGLILNGVVLDLVQNGTDLTGSYTGSKEPTLPLQFGRVENDRVVVWFHTRRNALITGNLELKDGWLTGRLTNSNGDVTRVTLRRQVSK